MAITKLEKLHSIKLKSLRKSHKISQNKMAEHLGLDSQQQYSDLENGKKRFTDDIILKICNLFTISILQFINNKANSTNLTLFLNKANYDVIENSEDSEIKITLYKKLLIELKMENTELKLKLLHKEFEFTNNAKNQTQVKK